MSNRWDCPECGSDRPGNHKRDCPGFARLVASRHEPDHGISPAQLREKVTSLDDESEVQAQRLNALEDASHKLREKVEALESQVGAQQSWMLDQSKLLDAALKRIEQLESRSARESIDHMRFK